MRQTNTRYRGSQDQFQDFTPSPSTGGTVLPFTANATTLNIGDVVVMAGTNIVDKATANPTKVIGIVVGGDNMPDKGIYEYGGATESTIVGTAAALAGQRVLVLVSGIALVVADGAITNGALIKISGGTAGQVTSATADADAGAIIGKLISVATVNAGDQGTALIFQA